MIEKCKVGKKYAESLCVFMQENFKGIQKDTMVSWDKNTRDQLGIMVSTKSGKEKHVFNYCPFCGGELFNQSLINEVSDEA